METSKRIIREQRLDYVAGAEVDCDDSVIAEESSRDKGGEGSHVANHSCLETADEDIEALDVEKFGTGHPWDDEEYPPLELNYDALNHIATYYLPGNHGKCTNINTIARGGFHEIRVLEFEDD